jgi:serine/threonine protein kinase
MRYLHSRDISDRDLTSDSILFDWDWTLRIRDCGHSVSLEPAEKPLNPDPNASAQWPSIGFCYLAPECYDNHCFPESRVFSFGPILYEILTAQVTFPKEKEQQMAFSVLMKREQPKVPIVTRELITDCWAQEAGE